MQKRMGFTVVELIIVMVIIAILLAIGTVSMRSMQSSARDKEREADVQAIQNYLEAIYAKEIRDGSGNLIKAAGGYPAHPSGASGAGKMTDEQFNKVVLKDMNSGVRNGPLAKEILVTAKNGTFGIANITGPEQLTSKIGDYNSNKLTGHPNGAYIYYAHNGPGTNCDTVGASCRRYLLLYHLETKDTNNWKMVTGERL